MNKLADATCYPILPSDSPFTGCEGCFVCFPASFSLLHGQLCHLSSFHYVSSKETLLANLESDVLQRAWVHRTKPKMWESYTFTQRRSWCCTRSSAPRLPSVRAKQHFHPAGSWPGWCGARGRRRGRSSGEEGQPGAELLSWGAASGEEAPAFDILLILGFGSGLKSREHDPVLDGLNLFEGSPLPDSSNIVTGAC